MAGQEGEQSATRWDPKVYERYKTYRDRPGEPFPAEGSQQIMCTVTVTQGAVANAGGAVAGPITVTVH